MRRFLDTFSQIHLKSRNYNLQYDLPVYFIGGIGGFIGVTIYAFFHNRMMAYVEDCIYGGKWDEYKGKENVD